MRSLSIVIPCHNEAAAIPEVLGVLAQTRRRLLDSGMVSSCQVLVVDDASSDDTARLLQNYDWLETLRLESRSGYGAALKAGFSRSKGERIAFFDIDATYDPRDLEGMVREIHASGVDLVMGERLSLGTGMPALRILGNGFFTWLVGSLYRYPVQDACTGYRLFHRKWMQAILSLPHDGLDFSLAMTLLSIRSGISSREVPVRYRARRGDSKLRILPDGGRFLWTILRGYFQDRSHAPHWVQ